MTREAAYRVEWRGGCEKITYILIFVKRYRAKRLYKDQRYYKSYSIFDKDHM